MAQTLTSLLIHVVFSTKDRRHLINREMELPLHSYMAGTLLNLGSPCLAIGGTSNHVHILISFSKKLALSTAIGELKKSSSKWMKSQGPANRHFAWQEGYGAFSIGQSQVSALKRYILKQHEHHRTKSFEDEFIQFLRKYELEFDEQFLWR